MYVRSAKRNAAIFFLLLLLEADCAASSGPRFPQCNAAEWQTCVPSSYMDVVLHTSGTNACVVCEVLNGSVGPTSPFSSLAGVNGVAIRGYPFHVLSAMKLAPLKQTVVHTLALIDAKIADVKNNTFAGFPLLNKLSLNSNRLTHVKQTWFTGLRNLFVLILSNNNIKQIEAGSFGRLTHLYLLELENNLLKVVHPSWFFGLKSMRSLNLRSNAINGISPASFQQLQLTSLDLRDSDLSCLDGEVLWGQSMLSRLYVSSGMLSSVHDAMPHKMMWSLHRVASVMRGLVTMVVEVPKFLFCVRQNAHELSLGWMFVSSLNVTGNTEFGLLNPGRSCGDLDSSLSTISIQPPVVVLASNGSLADTLDTKTLEQCRQVWECDGGITVALVKNPIFRLVSMPIHTGTESTVSKGIAMSFVQTRDTSTLTTTEGEHTKVFFTVPLVQRNTHTTETTYRTGTDHSSSPTHYFDTTEKDYTSSEPVDLFTLEGNTTPGPDVEVVQTPGHVLIPAVVSTVVVLVVSSLAVLIWKVCAARSNTEDDDRASDDAHVWTIPPGVAFPGLLRSASLPTCSGKMASDDAVSCRSLPAVLHSIEPIYSVIPDDVATAQRPLPGLPHVYYEIPDDVISGVVRSASLPACTRGAAPDDATSCRSLPAVLPSIEPTYSQIPDHMAAAHRPLPALPHTSWEIPDHHTATQRPLPVSHHTYSEIPDDEESGPMSFYADAGEISLHVVTNRRQNRRSGRSMATYGSTGQTNGQRNPFYRNAAEVEGIRSRRQQRTALVSLPADQGVSRYVNVTDAILSRDSTPEMYADDTSIYKAVVQYCAPVLANMSDSNMRKLQVVQNRACRLLLKCTPDTPTRQMHLDLGWPTPNTYWSWEIPGEGSRITPRRASLPTVTLPNTYWPWEIPGEGTRNTPRRVSLPTVTLPNTYWPWEIPGEGSRNTPRRVSLPTVTLPNTYWPWELQGDGTHFTRRRVSLPTGRETRNTPRRVSLPTVTLPNTYWPWEITGEGSRITPRRASLPTVTLPNTYWPWEIPGEGSRITPRRVSLPTVTLPNTYWPWEIPGEGSRITPRRVSLPTVTLPNTYWPWEIPGEGSRITPRRASLPTVTLPNTYWPWEIPGEGSRNTPRRVSLPTVTLPNTYWPWELQGDGTHFTRRRVSLPTVTLPNTYWPWEIPGEGTQNTAQRSSIHLTLPNTYWPWELPGEGTHFTRQRVSLPTVTLPNTYWPWEIPGEGTQNTAQRSSLPTVTLPNTYWPWELPGEGTCNTPRRASLPTVTLPNTYWPWEIPGEGTCNTPRRAPLPTVTLPNTYWPWEIPGEGTQNTAQRSSIHLTLPNTYW
ncbi:hypothetical protein Bbelb_313310 [Branchiostoma belcheri]|nr:hypothetical protein Bbelb_313310 [Branchiostoma belcheri]